MKCEMNSGEGNGKPLLDSNSCLRNPLLDLPESIQTRRTTTKCQVQQGPGSHSDPT